jgi:hypothetical protein
VLRASTCDVAAPASSSELVALRTMQVGSCLPKRVGECRQARADEQTGAASDGRGALSTSAGQRQDLGAGPKRASEGQNRRRRLRSRSELTTELKV